jgi:hypothetical protein
MSYCKPLFIGLSVGLIGVGIVYFSKKYKPTKPIEVVNDLKD